MKQLTYKDLVDLNPCKEHRPSKYIPKNWTGTILDVLNAENVAPAEKVWVAYKVLDDRILRLFAVNCARRALSRINEPDPRSIEACNVAERYANGEATVEGLSAARYAADVAADAAAYHSDVAADAAYVAAYAAAADVVDVAAYAASNAAYAASYAAAYHSDAARKKERETQIKELIKLIEEV